MGYHSEVCAGYKKETLIMVSDFLMMPHIRKYSDARLYVPLYIHNLFKDIERGFIAVIRTCYDDIVLGFEMGILRNDGLFEHHAFWKRNADGYQCIKGTKEAFEKYCNDKRVELNGYVSNIPKCNRAAIMLTRKFGCLCVKYDDGNEKKDFIDRNGNKHYCDSYYMRIGD